MSKTLKIVRLIIACIIALIASFALVLLILSIVDIVNGQGLAVLLPWIIFVYGVPVAIATIIYQIVLRIIVKKIWKVDLIASIYLLAVWISSLLTILITALLTN